MASNTRINSNYTVYVFKKKKDQMCSFYVITTKQSKWACLGF